MLHDKFDVDNLQKYSTNRLLEKKQEYETAYDSGQLDSWFLSIICQIDDELERRMNEGVTLYRQPDADSEYVCVSCGLPLDTCTCHRLPLPEY